MLFDNCPQNIFIFKKIAIFDLYFSDPTWIQMMKWHIILIFLELYSAKNILKNYVDLSSDHLKCLDFRAEFSNFLPQVENSRLAGLSKIQPKILHGEDANPTKYPWFVSLRTCSDVEEFDQLQGAHFK